MEKPSSYIFRTLNEIVKPHVITQGDISISVVENELSCHNLNNSTVIFDVDEDVAELNKLQKCTLPNRLNVGSDSSRCFAHESNEALFYTPKPYYNSNKPLFVILEPIFAEPLFSGIKYGNPASENYMIIELLFSEFTEPHKAEKLSPTSEIMPKRPKLIKSAHDESGSAKPDSVIVSVKRLDVTND